MKRKRALTIIRNVHGKIHKVSFKNEKLGKWVHANRRVGRPRQNWTEETIKEIWDHLKQDHEEHKYTAFSGENDDIINLIKQFASIQ